MEVYYKTIWLKIFYLYGYINHRTDYLSKRTFPTTHTFEHYLKTHLWHSALLPY